MPRNIAEIYKLVNCLLAERVTVGHWQPHELFAHTEPAIHDSFVKAVRNIVVVNYCFVYTGPRSNVMGEVKGH